MRAILRAAYYELRSRPDVPARVVVTEYVDVAAAFFGPDECGMINAVLDALARQTRPGEFAATDKPARAGLTLASEFFVGRAESRLSPSHCINHSESEWSAIRVWKKPHRIV